MKIIYEDIGLSAWLNTAYFVKTKLKENIQETRPGANPIKLCTPKGGVK